MTKRLCRRTSRASNRSLDKHFSSDETRKKAAKRRKLQKSGRKANRK